MSLSDAAICNMALSHLGHDKQITALDDRSAEARACLLWFSICRDEMLRGFAWPFAVTTETLALVEDMTAVDGAEWGYSYAYPDTALKLLRFPNGRNPTPETTIKYRIVRSDEGKLLYTDEADATIEYIVQVTDANEFPPDFAVALSYLVASRICAVITTDGKGQKLRDCMELYGVHLKRAKATALNEQTPDIAPDGPYLGARA